MQNSTKQTLNSAAGTAFAGPANSGADTLRAMTSLIAPGRGRLGRTASSNRPVCVEEILRFGGRRGGNGVTEVNPRLPGASRRRHCEERSDEAIQTVSAGKVWIASLRSQ